MPIDENLSIAQELLKQAAAIGIILEVEIGVVGGEEDGVEAEINEKLLYTSPEDLRRRSPPRCRRARQIPAGRDVRQRSRRLQAGQRGAQAGGAGRGQTRRVGQARLAEGSKPFDFVFHGGSGRWKSEIEDALNYGVVKMNVDTDTQYAFTRPIAAHMFSNYDGVLKVDGEVGNKKVYDPRSYLKKAETSMSERVVEAQTICTARAGACQRAEPGCAGPCLGQARCPVAGPGTPADFPLVVAELQIEAAVERVAGSKAMYEVTLASA